MDNQLSLYDFPTGHIGRKTFVNVKGHSKSVPKYKTYSGHDGLNYLRPEYGGSWDALPVQSTYYIPDKAAYLSPMSRDVVEGRSAHREHMRVHGVMEAGDIKFGSMSAIEKAPLPSVSSDIRRAIQELNGR